MGGEIRLWGEFINTLNQITIIWSILKTDFEKNQGTNKREKF